MSNRRRRNAEDSGSDEEQYENEYDEESVDSTTPISMKNKSLDSANRNEVSPEVVEKTFNSGPHSLKVINRVPLKKDPAFVPREGQFFLHDDREGQANNKLSSHANRSASASYVRPVRNGGEDSWKHDKFDQINDDVRNNKKASNKSPRQKQPRSEVTRQTNTTVASHRSNSDIHNAQQIRDSPRQLSKKSSDPKQQQQQQQQQRQPQEHHQQNKQQQRQQHQEQQQQHQRIPRRSVEERQNEQHEQRRLKQQQQPAPRIATMAAYPSNGGDIPTLSASVAGLRVSEREALLLRDVRSGPPAVAYGTAGREVGRSGGYSRKVVGQSSDYNPPRGNNSKFLDHNDEDRDWSNNKSHSRNRLASRDDEREPAPRHKGNTKVIAPIFSNAFQHQKVSSNGDDYLVGNNVIGGVIATSPMRGAPPGLDNAVLNPTARIFQPTPSKLSREGTADEEEENHEQSSSAGSLQATAYSNMPVTSAITGELLPVSYLSYYNDQQQPQQQQQQEYEYSVIVPSTYSGGGGPNGTGYTSGMNAYGSGSGGMQQQHYTMPTSAAYAQQLTHHSDQQQMMVNAYGQAVPMMYATVQQQGVYNDGTAAMSADLYGGNLVGDGAGGAVWYRSMADQQQQAQASGTVYYSVAPGATPTGIIQPQQQSQQQYVVNYGISGVAATQQT